MRSRLLLVPLVLVVAIAAAGCGGGSEAVSYRGAELPERPVATGFTLRDENGKLVTLSGLRGNWVLLTFLYTWCPDVCPVIAGNLNAALRTPVAKRMGLRVLSVSVDPARDTPAAVRTYVRDHRLLPTFRWLLGTRAELARVWDAYDIAVLPGPKKTVSHSAIQILIDPEGHERLFYDAEVQTADVVADLRTLEDE
jgi:protein SCO1/2